MWINYNPMTERTDILYINKVHKTVFNRKWPQS